MEWTQLATRWQRRPRGTDLALCTALAVALYATLLGWALPLWLRHQLPQWSAETIGQPLSVGELRIDPWQLRLQLRDLALGEQPWARLSGLSLDIDPWRSLQQRRLLIASVDIDQPWLALVREADGHFRLPALPPSTPAAEPRQPPPLEIEALRLKGGALDYRETWQNTDYARRLQDITLELLSLSTLAGEQGTLALSLASQEGEHLEIKGTLGLQPLAADMSLQLAGLDLARLGPRLQGLSPVDLSGGKLDATVTAHLQQGDTFQLLLENGRLTLTNLALSDSAHAPLLSLGGLELNGLDLDLQQRKLVVDRLALRAPTTAIQRLPSGALDLPARLATRPASTGAPPSSTPQHAPQTTSPPWQWQLGQLELSEGRIDFSDATLKPAFTSGLQGLKLDLSGLSGDMSHPLPLQLETRLSSDGRINLKGSVTPAPLGADVSLALEGLELPPIQPYLRQQLNATLASGQLNGALKLKASTGPSLQIDGRLGLAGFRLLDPQGRDFAVAERLNASGIELSGAPWRLHVGLVDAERTYGRFTLYEDRSSNASRMLEQGPEKTGTPSPTPSPTQARAPQQASTPAASTTLAIDIDRLQVRQGSAYFTDYAIKPRFATAITDIQGEITGVSNTRDTAAQIRFTGNAGDHAPVKLAGHARPFAPDRDLKLGLDFHNIELTTFSPYSGTFAGYKISKGKLNLALDYTVENRKLKGDNKIVVDQLTLGEQVKSKNATSLPVKLAVALLKDDRGVIQLDLPVTGSLDDPKFSVGGLVLKAFVAVIKKAVTAPFALLGSLFDGGPQALDSIAFAPGASTVDPGQSGVLEHLAKALQQRPSLKLNLRGEAGSQDAPALRKRWLDEQLANAKGVDPQEKLEALYQQRTGEGYGELIKRLRQQMPKDLARAKAPAEATQRLLTLADIDAGELQALALQRARAVQSALVLQGISAERLYLLDSRVAAPNEPTPAGVTLSLDAH